MIKKIVIGVVAILAIASVYLYMQKPHAVTPQTKAEAIKQAKEYIPPGQSCIQVITPATHDATGAKYTFSTPCAVPPGWTPDK